MNLYQCQEKAKKDGFDSAKFWAMFPAGPVECMWLDAYMGLFNINYDGLEDSFVTVRQIDEKFPNLICSDLFFED